MRQLVVKVRTHFLPHCPVCSCSCCRFPTLPAHTDSFLHFYCIGHFIQLSYLSVSAVLRLLKLCDWIIYRKKTCLIPHYFVSWRWTALNGSTLWLVALLPCVMVPYNLLMLSFSQKFLVWVHFKCWVHIACLFSNIQSCSCHDWFIKRLINFFFSLLGSYFLIFVSNW